MNNTDAATEQERATLQLARKKGDSIRKAALRKITWGLLIHVAFMMGGAFGQSDYDYITRYLDVNYGTWIDENGDGYGDGLGYDVDQDGYWDAYRFSTFTNGYLNVVVFDTSGNESFSSARFYVDSNGTGRFDVTFNVNGSEVYIAYDPDEDGSYNPWIALHQPGLTPAQALTEAMGTIGGSSPDIGTMLHSILTRGIANRWNEPACNGSVNGCR